MPSRTLSVALLLLLAGCDRPPDAAKASHEAPKGAVPTVVPPASEVATVAAPVPVVAEAPLDGEHVALPDSLVATGIPPIPKGDRRGGRGLLGGALGRVLDWHPREHSAARSRPASPTPAGARGPRPGAARRQLTFFRDRVGAATYPPAGDGGFFVFSKDIGGNEFAQNWRLDRATGRSTLLTDGASKNTLGPWSNGGRAPRVHVDAADPQGHRPLHRRPGRAPERPPASPRSRGAAGRRSTGRRTTSACW
jgi:hypothetical protein